MRIGWTGAVESRQLELPNKPRAAQPHMNVPSCHVQLHM
jgi:hypothetical protein